MCTAISDHVLTGFRKCQLHVSHLSCALFISSSIISSLTFTPYYVNCLQRACRLHRSFLPAPRLYLAFQPPARRAAPAHADRMVTASRQPPRHSSKNVGGYVCTHCLHLYSFILICILPRTHDRRLGCHPNLYSLSIDRLDTANRGNRDISSSEALTVYIFMRTSQSLFTPDRSIKYSSMKRKRSCALSQSPHQIQLCGRRRICTFLQSFHHLHPQESIPVCVFFASIDLKQFTNSRRSIPSFNAQMCILVCFTSLLTYILRLRCKDTAN